MLEKIGSLLDILERTPPPIDYVYISPRPQWLPNIALKKNYQNKEFWLALVGINNLSSQVLSSLRIKLPFAPECDPTIDMPGALGTNTPAYDAEMREIYVSRIDPGEAIYIAIFLSDSERLSFTEPQVIINDRLLSRGMKTVGFFKGRPKQALVYFSLPLLTIILAITLVFLVHQYYQISPLNPKVRLVEDAFRQYRKCMPTAYANFEVSESLLARHLFGEKDLLDLNRVATRQDLFHKDYVIICEIR